MTPARRILLCGFEHETNTFATAASGLTGLDQFMTFEADTLRELEGDAIYIGGMQTAARRLGLEAVPTYMASAQPSGLIEQSAFEAVVERLVDEAKRALPVDAVALELHGAAITERTAAPEAELGRRLRQVVGPDVPLVACLDLHAQLTPELVDAYDLLLPVKHYPHVDMGDRGEQLVELLHDVLERGVRPVMRAVPVGFGLPPTCTMPGLPGAAINEACAAWEQRQGVLDCSVVHGFPYATGGAGSVVLCTTDGDPELATEAASAMADWVRANRDRFTPEAFPAADAIRWALAAPAHPVVLAEACDNPGCGAPGDGTVLLRALVEAGAEGACFGAVVDPATVVEAQGVGVGNTARFAIGGTYDPSGPLVAEATVEALTDGRFVLQAVGRGAEVCVGPTAMLRVGGVGGVEVVVSSVAMQVFDPEIFRIHGIDVADRRIVGLKSTHHFRAGFEHVARDIIAVDGPGFSPLDLSHLDALAALPDRSEQQPT